MLNKICTCCFCTECACQAACCIDAWSSVEACGLANLECGACCWAVCAPICHSCSMGDFGTGMGHCVKGLKYCLYSCILECIAPIDGCYNCVMYTCDIFGSGVSGFKDITKHSKWLNEKVKGAFGL